MQSLMLGIDGGGTRCRGRLTDAQGQLLAEARGGPANVWSHFEAAIDAIDRVIDDLFTQAALPAAARAQTVLVAGLAGANVASVKARLESWLPVPVINTAPGAPLCAPAQAVSTSVKT